MCYVSVCKTSKVRPREFQNKSVALHRSALCLILAAIRAKNRRNVFCAQSTGETNW